MILFLFGLIWARVKLRHTSVVMRSLFLKIFVWFWIATALVSLALVVATATTHPGPLVARWRLMAGMAIALHGETAAEIYERHGPEALAAYFQRVERTAFIRSMLFDERGEEVAGRGAGAPARALAQRAGQSGGPVFEFPATAEAVTLVAQRVTGPGGAPHVIVCEVPRPRFAALNVEPGALAVRLLAVVLTAGLVCYGLARYLTAPVAVLRAGVRRFASGDLSARVGPRMGARRDELADLGRDFDMMAERIESLVSAQQRLLGDISHELRSPLARLNVALGLARQRAGREATELNSALNRIEREAERLNEMIGQLLTLARLESGAEAVEQTPVDLSQLVGEVAADADFEARSRHRRVCVTDNEACATQGNKPLLRSAIENVVRNAVRYTAEGTEVEIALRRRRAQPGAARDAAVITVRDHGPGVPESALANLFRPFYRVEDARERQSGGTGLGLAITERAVRLHRGTVRALNASGGGLIIEIILPVTSDP
jgi:two-component system sensor histidine kinase CpxA